MSRSALTFANQTVLVTGASGYIGTQLCHAINGHTKTLIRLARRPLPPLMATGTQVIDLKTDLGAESDLVLPVAVDIVYHLAAETSLARCETAPQQAYRLNVLGVIKLLEAIKDCAHPATVIYAGAATQVGMPTTLPISEQNPDHPLTHYDLLKLQAEQWLQLYARQGIIRTTSLRLCNVYGPAPEEEGCSRGILNKMIRRALQGHPLTRYGHGDEIRDYIYLQDVIEAMLICPQFMPALDRQHFVLGSGSGHTLKQTFELIQSQLAALCDHDIAIQAVPWPPNTHVIERRNCIADSSRFSAITGWQPRIGLAEGILATAQYQLQSRLQVPHDH